MLGLYFLGTSSGIPTKERNVSGIALTLPEPKSWLLVDCGEGTQHQILKSPLSLVTLKAIYITHVHGDHCYGLPGLIASAGMAGRVEPLLVIGPKEIKQMYLAIQQMTQLFIPFEVIFIETELLGTHTIGQTESTAIVLSHRVTSHAFCFTTRLTKKTLCKDRLLQLGIKPGPLWGELQQGNDINLANGRVLNAADFVEEEVISKKVVVSGDNDDPNMLTEIIKDTDVLVHESTYTEELLEKVGPEPQHCSAKRIAEFSQRHNVPNLVLTHFSARFQSKTTASYSISEIENEAKKSFSGNLYLANDHDQFTLDQTGKFTKNRGVIVS